MSLKNESEWKFAFNNSVSPYLVVPKADETVEFLKKTFGAEVLRTHLRKNGSVMHIEVLVRDSLVMIGDPGENWPAYTAHLHVSVDDAESTFKKALEAGGEPVLEPFSPEDDEQTKAAFKDPGGNTWWVVTMKTAIH